VGIFSKTKVWIGKYKTSLSGLLCQEDTFLLRTPKFSPKLAISIKFNLCNQDTSQLRTAVVSPKGVLNRVRTSLSRTPREMLSLIEIFLSTHLETLPTIILFFTLKRDDLFPSNGTLAVEF
jgi:hypothetical protein